MIDSTPIKVLHCITSLHPDGAQQMLLKVCSSLDPHLFRSAVVSLSSSDSVLRENFERRGIPVELLGMHRFFPSPAALSRLKRLVQAFSPDIIQGWMFHGNLGAWAAARMSLTPVPTAWNIRRALHSGDDRLSTRAVIHLNRLLSGSAASIVYCGDALAEEFQRSGFAANIGIVIPNGFDTERYRPRTEARRMLRRTLRLSDDAVIVGAAGRFHPQKDYPSLLAAAAEALPRQTDTHLVLAGRSMDAGNSQLASIIRAHSLEGRVHLLGPVADIENFYPALDIFCSSSLVEGFSNVLGEAMSSAVPCIATNTGAASQLAGDAAIIVSPGRPSLLAEALFRLVGWTPSERADLGRKARNRILQHFSLEAVTEQYARLYAALHGRTSVRETQRNRAIA